MEDLSTVHHQRQFSPADQDPQALLGFLEQQDSLEARVLLVWRVHPDLLVLWDPRDQLQSEAQEPPEILELQETWEPLVHMVVLQVSLEPLEHLVAAQESQDRVEPMVSLEPLEPRV